MPEAIPSPSVSVGSIGSSGADGRRVNAIRNKALADFRLNLCERRRTRKFRLLICWAKVRFQPHSILNALTGSILVARRAGNHDAQTATINSVPETAT